MPRAPPDSPLREACLPGNSLCPLRTIPAGAGAHPSRQEKLPESTACQSRWGILIPSPGGKEEAPSARSAHPVRPCLDQPHLFHTEKLSLVPFPHLLSPPPPRIHAEQGTNPFRDESMTFSPPRGEGRRLLGCHQGHVSACAWTRWRHPGALSAPSSAQPVPQFPWQPCWRGPAHFGPVDLSGAGMSGFLRPPPHPRAWSGPRDRVPEGLGMISCLPPCISCLREQHGPTGPLHALPPGGSTLMQDSVETLPSRELCQSCHGHKREPARASHPLSQTSPGTLA